MLNGDAFLLLTALSQTERRFHFRKAELVSSWSWFPLCSASQPTVRQLQSISKAQKQKQAHPIVGFIL